MADESILGIKAATAVAGFLGSVVSLSVIPPMTRGQAMLAVLTGAITSAYGTPLFVQWFGVESKEAQNGLAFFVGLVALHLIPGLVKLAELFRNDPMGFISRLKSAIFGQGGSQ